MYWQKRFDRENPDAELENIIMEIRKENKDFVYCNKHPFPQNVMAALNEAIEITSDCKYTRTFHSDCGWAYQMKAYSYTLKSNRIYQSMSRKGNCYDNSIKENFFGVMKQEMYYDCVYYSYKELKDAIEKYIDYYNNQRIRQKLSWMSSVEYRLGQAA